MPKKPSKLDGPNWKRIEKLRDHIRDFKQTKYRRFYMPDYIKIISGMEGRDLRRNGARCGSAFCLAGDAVIQFAPSSTSLPLMSCDYVTEKVKSVHPVKVEFLARELLNLFWDEGRHMFGGSWIHVHNDHITRGMAVRYLTEVLKQKNVMVSIDLTEAEQREYARTVR